MPGIVRIPGILKEPCHVIAKTVVSGCPGTRRIAAWTWEVLSELKMERWAGIFRFTSTVYETLYEDAQTLFEKPVWYRPDSPTTAVPLLGS